MRKDHDSGESGAIDESQATRYRALHPKGAAIPDGGERQPRENDEQSAPTQPGHQAAGGQQPQRGQQQPAHGGNHQPAQGQQAYQQPSGQPPAGGPGSAQAGDDGGPLDDLSRRQLLIGGGGVAAAAAGGWWFFLRGPDGAEAAVVDYLEAYDEGDRDTALDLVYEDTSLESSLEGYTDQEFYEQAQEFDQDIEFVEEFDSETDIPDFFPDDITDVTRVAYAVEQHPENEDDADWNTILGEAVVYNSTEEGWQLADSDLR